MNSISPDKFEMFKNLRELNCCSSCSIRLIYIQSTNIFQNSENYPNINDTDEDKPCFACMGILKPNILEETVKQVKDSSTSTAYSCATFNISFSPPVCLLLRNRYLQIHLTRVFSFGENHTYVHSQSIKNVLCSKIYSEIRDSILKQQIVASSPSSLSVSISYIYADDKSECSKFSENYDAISSSNDKKNSNFYSRSFIEKLLKKMSDDEFMKCYTPPSPESLKYITIGPINYFHSNIHIGGRYNKLSRHLSQTPWFINGEKKMETSVQDLLCNRLVEYTKAESMKFLSSGREDVDVRTINNGRPFAVDLINPKVTAISAQEFEELVNEINASTKLVKITSGLKILLSDDLKKIKEGENAKTKFYRTLCISRDKTRDAIDLEQFSKIKNLEIIQKTPIRVLHRRPLMPRVRVLHEMRARWLTAEEIVKIQEMYKETGINNDMLNRLFVFDLKTQAGTYVKEFMHGDFGRTRPNLCEILHADIDIVALDVTGINIDWP